MKRGRIDVPGTAGEIAAALSALQCDYHVEMDNRGSAATASRYIYVRKPFAAEVRVADHPSKVWLKKASRARIPMLDVHPRGLTATQAIGELQRLVG